MQHRENAQDVESEHLGSSLPLIYTNVTGTPLSLSVLLLSHSICKKAIIIIIIPS